MATKAKAKSKRQPVERPVIGTPLGEITPLNREAVAAVLMVSIRKFASMLATGEFPAPELHVGSGPRWTIACVTAWIEEQKSKPRPERTRHRKLEV